MTLPPVVLSPKSSTSSAELAVRLRRAAFNRALAEADLAAIEPLLMPDVVLVTGTDSAVVAGRKAQMLAWKREFASPDRLVYTRTPELVTPSPVHPIAHEAGNWQGCHAVTGAIVAEGCYSAKWRQVQGAWMLVAEIFVTMG